MTDPHAAEPGEDPEEHIGQEIADPWLTESVSASLRETGGAAPAIGTAPIPDPPVFEQARAEAPDWPLWFGGAGGER